MRSFGRVRSVVLVVLSSFAVGCAAEAETTSPGPASEAPAEAAATVTPDVAAAPTAPAPPAIEGTWTGSYAGTQIAGEQRGEAGSSWRYRNEGPISLTIAADGATLSSTATIDVTSALGSGAAARATSEVSVSTTTISGAWAFEPSRPLPYTATVSGNTMTGRWTCAGCTGTFTLTKE